MRHAQYQIPKMAAFQDAKTLGSSDKRAFEPGDSDFKIGLLPRMPAKWQSQSKAKKDR
jgi:hypothetical protein